MWYGWNCWVWKPSPEHSSTVPRSRTGVGMRVGVESGTKMECSEEATRNSEISKSQ